MERQGYSLGVYPFRYRNRGRNTLSPAYRIRRRDMGVDIHYAPHFPHDLPVAQGLGRVVLTADTPDGDITEAVEDHFGKGAGFAITLIYLP